ncbi:MAG: hypothetical protein EXR72_00100 [Myxococcales bacterium]|nr:hypothetical protein [Myxococcales bacterium]
MLAWLGSGTARTLPIEAIATSETRDAIDVFNLSVDGPEENYFAEGLLVHNKSYEEEEMDYTRDLRPAADLRAPRDLAGAIDLSKPDLFRDCGFDAGGCTDLGVPPPHVGPKTDH